MDITPWLERQFRIDINQYNRRCSRGDNFSNSVEFMRYKYRQYAERYSNTCSGSTGHNNRFGVGLPGFIQYLQYINGSGGYFIYMDIAIGMEW